MVSLPSAHFPSKSSFSCPCYFHITQPDFCSEHAPLFISFLFPSFSFCITSSIFFFQPWVPSLISGSSVHSSDLSPRSVSLLGSLIITSSPKSNSSLLPTSNLLLLLAQNCVKEVVQGRRQNGFVQRTRSAWKLKAIISRLLSRFWFQKRSGELEVPEQSRVRYPMTFSLEWLEKKG